MGREHVCGCDGRRRAAGHIAARDKVGRARLTVSLSWVSECWLRASVFLRDEAGDHKRFAFESERGISAKTRNVAWCRSPYLSTLYPHTVPAPWKFGCPLSCSLAAARGGDTHRAAAGDAPCSPALAGEDFVGILWVRRDLPLVGLCAANPPPEDSQDIYQYEYPWGLRPTASAAHAHSAVGPARGPHQLRHARKHTRHRPMHHITGRRRAWHTLGTHTRSHTHTHQPLLTISRARACASPSVCRLVKTQVPSAYARRIPVSTLSPCHDGPLARSVRGA